jgi:hypothetical protein
MLNRPIAMLMALVALVAYAAGASGVAAADPVAITNAPQLKWGFKQSWRVYTGRPQVSAGASVIDDSSTAGYDVGWTFGSGSYDAATGTTVLKYTGTTRWRSHPVDGGQAPPAGYDGPLDIDLLDLTFTDPIITINKEKSTISVEAVSRSTETWRLVDYGRVDVTDLAVDQAAAPVVTGATTTWSGIRASVDPGAGGPFGNNYIPGTDIDPVGFSYTGPGGMPDFAEHFDAPGTIKVGNDGDNVLIQPADTPNSTYETFAVDPAQRIAHTRLSTIADGQQSWTIRAFDLDAMRYVGEPLVVPAASEYGTVYLNDTNSGTLYMGVAGTRTIRATLQYDRALGHYVQGTLANAIPSATNAVSWDRVGQRAWEVMRTLADGVTPAGTDSSFDAQRWWLRTFTLQDDGTWVTRQWPLPGGGTGLNRGLYRPQGAVAADGSFIVLGNTRVRYATNPVVLPPATTPGAYRVVLHDDGTDDVAPVAGTDRPNGLDLYTAAVPSPDGTVALAALSSATTTVQALHVGAGGVTADAPVVLPIPYPEVKADAIAVDPEDGTIWAAGLKSRRLAGVRDGRVVADQVIGHRDMREPALIAGPGHALWMQSDDGAEDNLRTHAVGFQKLQRLGVSPGVEADPAGAAVSLGVGVDAADATFGAVASGGDPAPGVRWQVKAPGASRFADVAGASGGSLTVSARPGMDGTQYRAVFANGGGSIASAAATLGVDYAPRVRVQPGDATVVPGHDAAFDVVADGHPEPGVRWQYRVGGFWQDVDPDAGDFAVAGGHLVVKDANMAQSGVQVRARVANAAGAVTTRGAVLTVAAPQARALTGVHLDWTGSAELQRRAPNGAAHVFSAGVSDGTEATYAASARGVRIVHRAVGGGESAASWATRDLHLSDGGTQVVRLIDGTGTVDARGVTTVSWATSFTVNMYGGLVPFTIKNPKLVVDADGEGALTGTLSGYASSQADPSQRTPLAPFDGVTIATVSGARVDPDGATTTIAPAYDGVSVDATPAQQRSGDGWGAWPQGFVAFQSAAGLGSYWYSSGGAADPYKKAAPFAVTVTGQTIEPPEGEEPAGPPAVAPPAAAPAPQPAAPAPITSASARRPLAPLLGASRAKRTVNRTTGTALIATITCRTGPCTLTRASSVRIRIHGHTYTAAILGDRTIHTNRSARLTLRLPAKAIRALRGHTATARLKVTVASPSGRAQRTFTITLR